MIGGSENFAMKWTILVESSKRGRVTRIFVGTFHVSCHLNIYLSFPFREIFLLILLSKSFFARSCEKLASANFSTILSPQLSFEFLPAKTKHRRIVSRLITWKLCEIATPAMSVTTVNCQEKSKKKFPSIPLYFAKRGRFISISERVWTRSMEEVGWRSARDREKPFVLCCTRCLDIYAYGCLDEWTIFG